MFFADFYLHSNRVVHGSNVGDASEYFCDRGFQTDNGSHVAISTCLAAGQWSTPALCKSKLSQLDSLQLT